MPSVKNKRRVYTAKYKHSKNFKRFILFFSVAIAIVAIPVTVKLVQEQQDQRSSAERAKTYKGEQALTIPEKDATVPGQILVKLKDSVPDKTFSASKLKTKHKGRIKRTIPNLNIDVVEVSVGEEDKILSELKNDPDVEYAVPDFVVYAADFMPNDPDFIDQYGLHNTGWDGWGTNDADVDAPRAWDFTRGKNANGQPIKVAVLDTGIDGSHPDLAGKVILNANFVSGGPSAYSDNNGHGTNVAGIIAANTNNGQGVAGMCPECVLLNGKVLNDNGASEGSSIINGMQWAANNGAQIINMSLGGQTSAASAPVWADAVNYAWVRGAIVVAAAGNQGGSQPFYPAYIPTTVSVAATDPYDLKANFSNFGNWVDVAAPGASIYSTYRNHGYAYYNGTSQAAPFVSGTLALILARYGNMPPQNTIHQLQETTDSISGTGTYWIHGRINATNAVTTVVPTPTVQPTAIPTVKPPVKQKPKPKKKKRKKKKKKKNKNRRGSVISPFYRTFS